MTVARTSIALLAIQLALVSSIAAKYLYQRNTCPRVWTRALAYDPQLVMRGRYISAQLRVDACGVNQPEESQPGRRAAPMEFDANGHMRNTSRILSAVLGVRNGRLVVSRFSEGDLDRNVQELLVKKDSADCENAILEQPVDIYLSEKVQSPFPLSKGVELWVEVTTPPAGPPRPIGMAMKEKTGQWEPLNYR